MVIRVGITGLGSCSYLCLLEVNNCLVFSFDFLWTVKSMHASKCIKCHPADSIRQFYFILCLAVSFPGPSNLFRSEHAWLAARVLCSSAFCHLHVVPGGADDKESTCQCRRHKRRGFNLWLGKIPWRRKCQPPLGFLLGRSPWTEKPGGLQSMGSHSRTDWSDLACTHISFHLVLCCLLWWNIFSVFSFSPSIELLMYALLF